MKLLIIGANGFIGSNLCTHILKSSDWEIFAMDLSDNRLAACRENPRFQFKQGDFRQHKVWVANHVRDCDLVLPLAAIANPATYINNPLAVFELDFEANLDIVRLCVKFNKRIVFPSTSEVYGMSRDGPFDEDTSTLVTGPITMERWIYSSSKQLMDRVIYAYGKHCNLPFSLFRPFNWFGPGLDNVWAHNKSNRVITKFLSNLFYRQDIVLIDGGAQKRCFLYIDDAIDALMRILENKEGCASNRIFNIGHPGNEASIAELADMMLGLMAEFPGYEHIRDQVKITRKSGEAYYGAGYQDVDTRVPSIAHARAQLGWEPATGLRDALRKTIAHYYPDAPKQ